MIMKQKLLKHRAFQSTNLKSKLVLMALIVILPVQQAAAFSEDKNWPCIQRKVIKLSAGQMWRGNPVDEKDVSWQQNKDVRELVKQILPRRVKLKETEKIIEEFADKHNDNRNKQLEQSFLALLSETNKIRQEIIAGIGKFSSRQKSLSKRIIENRNKINEFEKKDTDGTLTKEEDKEFAKLEQQQEWDIRIRDEREKSLEYVCESPVLLEQRLFALSQQLKKFYK
jgi:Spy/CpxP family protein refolding chaperone